MATPLRLVFMGSDTIALPLLEWLVGPGAALGSLVAVYTQPDRPIGRGQKVQANGIKTWALERGIEVRQPEKLTEAEQAGLAALKPDLALVMAYGHILKDAFIATPTLGTVNFHASILPDYRGASPIQTAVACGETQTGISFMRIVRALDAGPVADIERVPIGPEATALDVETLLSKACVPLIERSLPRMAAGQLSFAEQAHEKATFCRRLAKEDGVIDFNRPATALASWTNGLNPWPSVTVSLAGTPLKFGRARAEQGSGPAPGTVLPSGAAGLRIATAEGVLCILELQRPGGRMLPAAEFLRGFPIAEGTLLPSTPMPPLKGATPFR